MWETIKQILHKNGGTCIIVEEGKPSYIVSRFDEYQKLLENQPAPRLREGINEQELLEKINQEINNWKTKQAENIPENELDIPEVSEEEDLKIENLPIV
ncbi:hypothetical protein KJ853_04495 [Patescibacteria group bacterium]|nr:hypothetical protein [Patescibacteria group bacterium]